MSKSTRAAQKTLQQAAWSSGCCNMHALPDCLFPKYIAFVLAVRCSPSCSSCSSNWECEPFVKGMATSSFAISSDCVRSTFYLMFGLESVRARSGYALSSSPKAAAWLWLGRAAATCILCPMACFPKASLSFSLFVVRPHAAAAAASGSVSPLRHGDSDLKFIPNDFSNRFDFVFELESKKREAAMSLAPPQRRVHGWGRCCGSPFTSPTHCLPTIWLDGELGGLG